MLGRRVRVSRIGWLAVALLLPACGPSEEIRQQLAQLEVVSAQKDSLVDAVTEYAQVMSDISAELAAVQLEGQELLVAVESPAAASRDSIMLKIEHINARVEQTETRLRQSRRRVSQLNHVSDSLKAALESTISNYEGMLATQRETIAGLTEQVAGLESEREQLAAEITELEAEATEAATAYYVIGTKEDLLERGIIEKEGGAKVLFVLWRKGETLVPGRNLDPAAFTAIDRREITQIELPENEKGYSIVSRHDTSYLATTPDEKGKIWESIEIASPDEFWSVSPFLIIITEG